jgi:5-methylcytosine-specific restriction endonuclease McrA
MTYYCLSDSESLARHIAKEREKARKLKKTQWWLDLLNKGICTYCQKQFTSKELTMDHIVPLARSGLSTKNNIAVSCKSCNEAKKLNTPVDLYLNEK